MNPRLLPNVGHGEFARSYFQQSLVCFQQMLPILSFAALSVPHELTEDFRLKYARQPVKTVLLCIIPSDLYQLPVSQFFITDLFEYAVHDALSAP